MTEASLVDRADVLRARRRLIGLVCVLGMVGATLLALIALDAESLGNEVDSLGLSAAPLMVVLGVLLIVALVPASLVAGASGYAFGVGFGTIIALSAAVIGGLLCALIGRQIGTPAARAALGARTSRLIRWLDGRPLRCVVIARLTPGLPFNATSYLLGITRIRARDIALGTAIGFSPRCFAYVALGGSLRDLSSPEARAALAGSVLLLVLVVLVPRLLPGRGRAMVVSRGL